MLRERRAALGQVFVFGRDDPVRTRFAVSPLWETMAAVRVLLEPHRHAYHLPWLDDVRPDLDRLDLAPLLALSPLTGWTPDFLSGVAAGPRTMIAEQLAQARATPLDEVAREARRSLTEQKVKVRCTPDEWCSPALPRPHFKRRMPFFGNMMRSA